MYLRSKFLCTDLDFHSFFASRHNSPNYLHGFLFFTDILVWRVSEKSGVSQISGWMESCLTLILGGSQIFLLARSTTNAESKATFIIPSSTMINVFSKMTILEVILECKLGRSQELDWDPKQVPSLIQMDALPVKLSAVEWWQRLKKSGICEVRAQIPYDYL